MGGGGIGEFFTPIGVSRGFHLGFWDRGFSRYLLHFSAVVIRLLEVLGVQEVFFLWDAYKFLRGCLNGVSGGGGFFLG